MDELDGAAIAALGFESEQKAPSTNPGHNDLRATLVVPAGPRVIPPHIIAPPPAAFRVAVSGVLLPG